MLGMKLGLYGKINQNIVTIKFSHFLGGKADLGLVGFHSIIEERNFLHVHVMLNNQKNIQDVKQLNCEKIVQILTGLFHPKFRYEFTDEGVLYER